MDHLFPNNGGCDLQIYRHIYTHRIRYASKRHAVGIRKYHIFDGLRYRFDTVLFLTHIGMPREDIVIWLLRFGSVLPEDTREFLGDHYE